MIITQSGYWTENVFYLSDCFNMFSKYLAVSDRISSFIIFYEIFLLLKKASNFPDLLIDTCQI